MIESNKRKCNTLLFIILYYTKDILLWDSVILIFSILQFVSVLLIINSIIPKNHYFYHSSDASREYKSNKFNAFLIKMTEFKIKPNEWVYELSKSILLVKYFQPKDNANEYHER